MNRLNNDTFYYLVHLPIPTIDVLIYSFNQKLAPGTLVHVSLKRATKLGLIIEEITKPQVSYQIKSITRNLFEKPYLNENQIRFFKFMASYYCVSLGDIFKTVLPSALLLNEKNLSKLKDKDIYVISKEVQKWYSINTQKQGEDGLKKAPKQLDLWKTIQMGPISLISLRQHPTYQARILNELIKKDFIIQEERAVLDQQILIPDSFCSEKITRLTDEQEHVIKQLLPFIHQSICQVCLLHGITGSGKTEVYLQLIKTVLDRGQSALVLVPEIALTPQMTSRFYSRFGNSVALIHSDLTPKEKLTQWQLIYSNKARIVIGARSALFAPIQDLGIIIIDEEHDSSFKQESGVRYNARDMAIALSRIHNIPIILGSATPSIESYYNAQQKKYQLHSLTKRATNSVLPKTDIIDMRQKDILYPNSYIFSKALIKNIVEETALNHQVILLLNRRGFSNYLMCIQCGFKIMCPNCQITLTIHKSPDLLKCHYCDYQSKILNICPQCHIPGLQNLGYGTQFVYNHLKNILPGISIDRLDKDTASTHKKLMSILDNFSKGKIQVLIGTQMLSKGHDFPKVSLVGIINPDNGLFIPDFRASEKTFQLLTQTSGRAGRKDIPGRVLIQTYNPKHYSIELSQKQDFTQFYKSELTLRQDLCFPPFTRLGLIEIKGKDEALTQQTMDRFYTKLESTIVNSDSLLKTIELLGPSPSPISKIKNKYRHQLIIKSTSVTSLTSLLQAVANTYPKRMIDKGVEIVIDRDPQSML